LKSKDDVIDAFNESMTREGLCAYLWYQVQEGDTLKTVSRKFYKTEDKHPIIEKANPAVHLEPGQKIRVLLPDLS
jgi:nucleoid-associated protein YgaU